MVIDTSRPGWTVLHADCNHAVLDGKQGEGQSLWDLFKVPAVVGHPPEPLQLHQHSALAASILSFSCINTQLQLHQHSASAASTLSFSCINTQLQLHQHSFSCTIHCMRYTQYGFPDVLKYCKSCHVVCIHVQSYGSVTPEVI